MIFALLISAVRSADHANQRTNDVLAATQSVSNLEKSLIDAETGMRGFVITGNETFLQPTEAARAAIPSQERAVRDLVAEDDERALLEPLFGGIDAYMTQWVDRAIAARRQSTGRAADLIETAEGKRRVDDLRAQFEAIRAGLRSDAAKSRDDARSSVRRAVIAALVGLLVSTLLYTLYTIYVGRSIVVPVRRVGVDGAPDRGRRARRARPRGRDGARRARRDGALLQPDGRLPRAEPRRARGPA